jgi:hypothetical protein
MAGKSKSKGKPRSKSQGATKAGLSAQAAQRAIKGEPHRGDMDEHKGRGGAATRGRGQSSRRGSRTPSRSKN